MLVTMNGRALCNIHVHVHITHRRYVHTQTHTHTCTHNYSYMTLIGMHLRVVVGQIRQYKERQVHVSLYHLINRGNSNLARPVHLRCVLMYILSCVLMCVCVCVCVCAHAHTGAIESTHMLAQASCLSTSFENSLHSLWSEQSADPTPSLIRGQNGVGRVKEEKPKKYGTEKTSFRVLWRGGHSGSTPQTHFSSKNSVLYYMYNTSLHLKQVQLW